MRMQTIQDWLVFRMYADIDHLRIQYGDLGISIIAHNMNDKNKKVLFCDIEKKIITVLVDKQSRVLEIEICV